MSLWDEIHEQPDTVCRMVDTNRSVAHEVASLIGAADIASVVIAARGTSDNAARYAQYVWGSRHRLQVALATPSLYTLYRRPPRLDGAIVIGISQSGESPDLVAVLQEARCQRRPTVAITNHPDSPLAMTADVCFELGSGEERATAATKTYTSQLAAVALIAAAMGGDDAGLSRVADDVTRVLAAGEQIADAASRFSDDASAAVIGRGFNLSTAFEWALKLQELAGVCALPFSTADFLHGPVALVADGLPVLAVAPSGTPLRGVHELLEHLRRDYGAKLAVISDDAQTLALADAAIPIAPISEWLSPIPAVVAAQLFTYYLTGFKGRDPDSPQGITKVTRTT